MTTNTRVWVRRRSTHTMSQMMQAPSALAVTQFLLSLVILIEVMVALCSFMVSSSRWPCGSSSQTRTCNGWGAPAQSSNMTLHLKYVFHFVSMPTIDTFKKSCNYTVCSSAYKTTCGVCICTMCLGCIMDSCDYLHAFDLSSTTKLHSFTFRKKKLNKGTNTNVKTSFWV